MAKIEILESAQRELEAIAELHMNLVGPNSARKITDRILDSLSRLERFPLSGFASKRCRTAEKRLSLCDRRAVSLRLSADCGYCVRYHIVHGASNYPVLFKRLLQEELKRED